MDGYAAAFGQGQLSQFSNFIWNMVNRTVGSIIDDLFVSQNREKDFANTIKLLDYQNKYNSPAEQMQRLSAAGLNPLLVYGSAAPAGVSGNAVGFNRNIPGSSFGTADLSLGMLQAKEMQRIDAEKEVLTSQAAKNNAEARYTNQQSDRYNELVNKQIEEANSRINEAASRMNLNASTSQLQAAQKSLAIADEAYRRGEISLQQFRRSEIIARTNLYRSEESLNRTKDYYSDIDGQMSVLELEYKKLFFSGDRMKQLSDREFKACRNEFILKAERSAAVVGIQGNKSAQWSSWIFDQLSKLLGGAASGSVAAGIKAGL